MSDRPGEFDPGVLPTDLYLAVVAARYNPSMAQELRKLVESSWTATGLGPANWHLETVPGSSEVPFGLRALLGSAKFDGALGLGIVVAGQTRHHETIAQATAAELHGIAAEFAVPVINGILVVENEEQAWDRLGRRMNRGAEFAQATVEMALLARRLRIG